MRVLITGATGFIGTALADHLRAARHAVVVLTRRPARGADELTWDPARGALEPAPLEGFDGVVHLASENLSAQRWSPAVRTRLRTSRADATLLLARTLARLARPPRVLVSASAVGIYGSRGDEPLDETSTPGDDFLARLCRGWEEAAAPAAAAGIRVVHPRTGLVLDPAGGTLRRILPLARFGLNGPLGGGRQWWSWVTRADVVRALAAMLGDQRLRGPVNVVAGALRQREFARALGRVLARPSWVPAPAFALRLVLGAMADDLVLASQRVASRALAAAGFAFADADLEPALRRLLGRP